MREESNEFIQIKVMFVGDSETGTKTSLIKRFTDGSFSDSYVPSVGVDFRSKEIHICGMDVSLQLWDTSGSKKFRTALPTYYRMAHCFIAGYSITDRVSFEDLSCWVKDVKEKGPDGLPLMIVGNKVDLEESRAVSYDEGKSFATENECLFYEGNV